MSIIRKVYGGITPLEPFSAREIRNINEKQIVAATAANFVNDGEIIYIDSGITTMHMIPYLADKQFLTIVTASVYVLDVAARYSNFNIIATGGTLQASLKDFIGSSVLNCI